MRYKIQKPVDPEEEKSRIFIIPLSTDPDHFIIIYPVISISKADKILAKGININRFEERSEEAVIKIKEELLGKLQMKMKKSKIKADNIFISGVTIAVLGVINWVIPDPMPLVDEIILTFGGAGIALLGVQRKRKKVPTLQQKVDDIITRINNAETEINPLLAQIYKSICVKADPSIDTKNSSDSIDPIDVESRWLVEFINIENLITSDRISTAEVHDTFKVLSKLIPFKRLIKLEKQIGTANGKKNFKLLQLKTCDKTGMTHDALTVYYEFFKSYENYFT